MPYRENAKPVAPVVRLPWWRRLLCWHRWMLTPDPPGTVRPMGVGRYIRLRYCTEWWREVTCTRCGATHDRHPMGRLW
jgi:hypothetical protein